MTAPQAGGSAGAVNAIIALMEQRAGQRIEPNRAWRVESALKPLLREHGFATLDVLVAALVGGQDRLLADAVIEALLNHESSFFRDPATIEQVGRLADDLQAAQPDRRLRIWSAGCSNGQEPLSLAMLFAEDDARAKFPDIQATDMSACAIARARAGRYSQFEIQRGLPVRRMMRWFEAAGDDWTARPDLLARVQFRLHNLAFDPVLAGQFDLILCRNVLLYLSPQLRRAVLAKLAGALRPDGRLVLGASETVIGQTEALVPCRRYRGFYRRCESADTHAPVAAALG